MTPDDTQSLAKALASLPLFGSNYSTVQIARALLPVVDAIADRRAADEIERLADERAWTTEHDNEVVSARELHKQVARLRGELEPVTPVTFDFPPDDDGGVA